jgi:hypothetical protein
MPQNRIAFAIESPSERVRPWTTTSGPVGFALPNSRETRSPVGFAQNSRHRALPVRGREPNVDEAAERRGGDHVAQ